MVSVSSEHRLGVCRTCGCRSREACNCVRHIYLIIYGRAPTKFQHNLNVSIKVLTIRALRALRVVDGELVVAAHAVGSVSSKRN